MIARLPPSLTTPGYSDFLAALKTKGFKGEVGTNYASRTVLVTDNSIYQRLPQAAIFPLDQDDVARLLAAPVYRGIKLTARGGGTGTNGQSLTNGVVVDFSRHMNKILDIDPLSRRVGVQAGVVKDQLNEERLGHTLAQGDEAVKQVYAMRKRSGGLPGNVQGEIRP
jgi:FAD/FMN-containing dehydrogenase